MRPTFNRRSLLSYCTGGAATALLLAFSSRSQAATTTFKATLNGASEVPPNQTTGSGTVTASFNSATRELSWNGSYSGLTGPVTAAHIHGPADPGKNAGVVFWISDHNTKAHPFPTSFHGSVKLSEPQATDLMDGKYYVNIHTAANPGGEIRGQLTKG
jgi:hypothetical protein